MKTNTKQKWRFRHYNRTGWKTTKTETKGLWFVEHSKKQIEGKRGTRTQDILIDLMWKLRSKGFGDQGSHTKRGELSGKESNKLHKISLYSMILLSHASSYRNILLLNFFHTKFVYSFVPQDLKDVLYTYANILGYKIHTVTNLSLLIVGNSGISFCRKEELLYYWKFIGICCREVIWKFFLMP